MMSASRDPTADSTASLLISKPPWEGDEGGALDENGRWKGKTEAALVTREMQRDSMRDESELPTKLR